MSLVVMKKPGEQPERVEMPLDIKSLQEAVGGYIEALRYGDAMFLLIDEDAKIKGSTVNVSLCGTWIYGNIVVVGEDAKKSDFFGLKDSQAKKVMELLKLK